jgi:drug/metabolite transporter (DMT)-like permease
MSHPSSLRFRVLLAFGLVYLFWGSTYLAIRITVVHIPPAVLCATRFLVAGVLMLAACAVTGRRVRVSGAELQKMAVIGVLLLTGGNLTLSWAEQYVPSGLAALIAAATPIWILALDRWLFRVNHLSSGAIAGLTLGIVGIVVLLWPDLTALGTALGHAELVAALGLLGGCLSWALGSVISHHWPRTSDPFVDAAWQITFAGLGNLLFVFILGEQHRVQWTWQGITGIAYLVVFGSWVGYTAYIYLLTHVSTAKVSTYAYVNPVVAVILGWLILHERVDRFIVAGSVIIIVAVVLVTRAKVKAHAPASDNQLAVSEAGARVK